MRDQSTITGRVSHRRRTAARSGGILLGVLLPLLASAAPLRSDDCAANPDDGRQAYLFPTPVSTLLPICTTVLECEALTHAEPIPGDSTLAAWQNDSSKDRQARACALAQTCLDQAAALVRPVAYPWMNGRQAPPYPIFHPDWRARAWAAELAEGLQAPPQSTTVVGQTGSARCPRIATINHLRRPIESRLEMAMELTRHLYGTQCDTVMGCLQVATGRADAWSQEQQWQAELADREEKAIAAEVASNVAIEAQMQGQTEVMQQQVEAIAAHGVEVSTGTQIAGVTVAGAVNEGLRSDRSLNRIQTIANRPETASGSAGDAGETLNLTDATLLLANSQQDVATSLDQGLGQIAAAMSGRNAAPPTSDVRRQIDPEADIESVYPDVASVGYAILLVPDPRIPRHRRRYDLSLEGVNRGMLDREFVLDRYAMPWQAYIDSVSNGGGERNELADLGKDDGKYGVLVYRRDRYRSSNDREAAFPSYELRVLYVVAESATYGAEQDALKRALLRVERVVSGNAPSRLAGWGSFESLASTVCGKAEPTPLADAAARPQRFRLDYRGGHFAAHPDMPAAARWQALSSTGEHRTLILGPTFSGSLTSVEAARLLAEDELAKGGLTSQSDLGGLRGAVADLVAVEWAQPALRTRFARYRLMLEEQYERFSRDQKLSVQELHQMNETVQHLCEVVDRDNSAAIQPINALRTKLLAQRLWAAASVRQGHALTLRMVSATTTASSNFRADTDKLVHHSLVFPDNIKLQALQERFPGGCAAGPCAERDVVIFSENSTFGKGLCPTGAPQPKLCSRAYEIPFPANIADIRANRSESERQAQRQARSALGLPDTSQFLDLAQGAENGSEFPDSQRSTLTSATSERELATALRRVAGLNPRIVIVAATDVRDRIFLFDRLRKAAPRALLVDLEADELMAHPRIIHATRGMLLLSSDDLLDQVEYCAAESRSSLTLHNFANGDQRALYRIVSQLNDQPARATHCGAHLHNQPRLYGYLPSRSGLKWGETWNCTSVDCTELYSHTVKPQQGNGSDGTAGASSAEAAPGTAPAEGGLAGSATLRSGSLIGMPMLLALGLAWIRRKSAPDPQRPYLARVNDQRFERLNLFIPIAILLTIWFVRSSFRIDPGAAEPSPYLFSMETGLAWGVAACTAIAGFILLQHLHAESKRLRLLPDRLDLEAGEAEAPSRSGLLAGVRSQRRFLPGADLVTWPLYLAALALAWFAVGSTQSSICPSCWPRSSVLSPWAEWLLLIAVVGLLTAAILFAFAAMRAFRQTLSLAQRAGVAIARGGGQDLRDWNCLAPVHRQQVGQLSDEAQIDSPDESPTVASNNLSDATNTRCGWLLPHFSTTPILARPSDFSWPFAALQGGKASFDDVQRQLTRINQGYVDELSTRLALGLLFATLVARLRLLVMASVLAASVVVLVGYLYPVTDRDAYLILAFVLLLLQVPMAGVVVIALERAPAVSRLLCNTPQGLALNWPTVASIATPVLLVIAALILLELPGVLEWSGGLLAWVMSLFL